MILIHKLTSLKFKTDGAIYHSKVVIIYERRRIERWFLEDVMSIRMRVYGYSVARVVGNGKITNYFKKITDTGISSSMEQDHSVE